MKNNLVLGIIIGVVLNLCLAVGSINSGIVQIKQSVPKETKCTDAECGQNTIDWVKFYAKNGYDVTIMPQGTARNYILAKKY